MNDDSADVEPQMHFPMFWRNAESLLHVHLRRLGLEPVDSDFVATDLMRRFSAIKAVLPINPDSQVHRDYGALMCDAVTAEQHLFAAQHGRMPGRLLHDWPQTPLKFEHPFLLEVQQVLGVLEADVSKATNGRRLN
jgi:hypothetical protein